MPTTGEISLYFHIPFCSKKCPYCHFFVLPDKAEHKAQFTQALLKEWTMRLLQIQGKRIVSVYFGGGTPTKLSPRDYQPLLDLLPHDCEITLEANPEDVTLPLMQEFRALGINRVSLGVQSLNDSELTLLGRTHNAHTAIQAIEATYNAGISNISIDLMFELPKQTLNTWENSLRQLSQLPITHLSLYNLTFEPHTVFFKHRQQLTSQLPPEDDRLQMLQIAVATLESIGLHRYEISAFAKPGMHSRHNTGYWTGRPFLGFGPSAFSYWDGARFSNAAHFQRYLTALEQGRLPVEFEEKLPFPRNLQELFAVQLRLVSGVDLNAFGPLPPVIETALQILMKKEWIAYDGNVVKLTPFGQLFYDSVASEII